MYCDETKIRVRYGETDKMGFVYYGFYSLYYEQARTEMIRKLGVTYKELEDGGLLLPVIRMTCKYILPAKYDEELLVKVCIPVLPTKRIRFQYEIFNEAEQLINIAETDLLFLDDKTKKVIVCPDLLLDFLAPHFN